MSKLDQIRALRERQAHTKEPDDKATVCEACGAPIPFNPAPRDFRERKTCGKRELNHVRLSNGPAQNEQPVAQSGPGESQTRSDTRATFDRTAYQREYMRKRRAAQKATK